jgi:hypothetical protein
MSVNPVKIPGGPASPGIVLALALFWIFFCKIEKSTVQLLP